MNQDAFTLELHIIGRVQGVGFRRFVEGTASKLGLSGWVKNLSDGSVKAVLQGKHSLVEEALILIKKGNRFSRVDSIQTKSLQDTPQCSSFQIIY